RGLTTANGGAVRGGHDGNGKEKETPGPPTVPPLVDGAARDTRRVVCDPRRVLCDVVGSFPAALLAPLKPWPPARRQGARRKSAATWRTRTPGRSPPRAPAETSPSPRFRCPPPRSGHRIRPRGPGSPAR